MLDVLKTELEKHKVFDAPDHIFVNALKDSISFGTVPDKMKTVFALSHLSSYATQFRRNVELWDGTLVPTNNISFVVADSGANKDSSNSKVRKCFQEGYDRLRKEAKEVAKEQAIERAKRAGEDMAEQFAVYKDFLRPVPPVFMSMTTGPGFVQHVNDTGELPIGGCSLYIGELSDELAHNPHALETIKILSELYDVGSKEATYTKGAEFRAQEVKGQPVSALMVGSPGHILYDESTKKKFQVAFMSKLARRSWFCYAPERIRELDFSSHENPIQAMMDFEQKAEEASQKAYQAVKEEIENLTNYNLGKLGEPIKVTEEVFDLFNIYKRYNREVIDSTNRQDTLYALVRAHLQWKALKLAGALAIIEQSDTLSIKHYTTAIKYCEMFDTDITDFEIDINKAEHERLSDYLKTRTLVDGKAFINIHDVKKRGFSVSVSKNRLKELAALCSGYDHKGVYSVAENDSGIYFEPFETTEVIGVSYKKIDNTRLNTAVASGDPGAITAAKNQIGATVNSDLIYGETSFSELAEMLKGDFAYSPFYFENGVRNKDNIVGGTKWLVFDVDKTHISYEDAHFILQGINHHVVLTSDASNKYKYRVLVELDAIITLAALPWKYFYTKVAEDLGLQVDVLPQSQIFFSYAGRPVLSCLDGTPVASREYLLYVKERENNAPISTGSLSTRVKNQQLDNPFDTFWYAFECSKGRRSVTFFRAIRHAIELGADLDYTLKLLEQFNEYITEPLEEARFDKLKQQATRLYES